MSEPSELRLVTMYEIMFHGLRVEIWAEPEPAPTVTPLSTIVRRGTAGARPVDRRSADGGDAALWCRAPATGVSRAAAEGPRFRREISVRRGEGQKDRRVMLAGCVTGGARAASRGGAAAASCGSRGRVRPGGAAGGARSQISECVHRLVVAIHLPRGANLSGRAVFPRADFTCTSRRCNGP